MKRNKPRDTQRYNQANKSARAWPAALVALTLGGIAAGAAVRAATPAPKPAHAGYRPESQTKAGAPSAAVPALETVETSKIRDLTCTLAVDSDETNFEELGRIGGAFATTYRIKHVDVTYEAPNKVRFESHVLGASVVMIYNGGKKVYHTPIKSGESDVSTQPGQKQSLMDLGIFAADYLATDYRPILLRREGNLLVVDLVQRNTDNKSHEVVWVNPKTAITERRQSFNGDGVLKKELRYRNPVQSRTGIWIPTRIEIFNQFGKLGAVQNVEDIRVNLGVDEQKFDVS